MQPNGQEMAHEHWSDGNNRCMGILLNGRAQPAGILKAGGENSLLIIVNAHFDVVDFVLPEVPLGQHWTLQLDTHKPALEGGEQTFMFGDRYPVTGRSTLLFELSINKKRLVRHGDIESHPPTHAPTTNRQSSSPPAPHQPDHCEYAAPETPAVRTPNLSR